jgi:pilus assembly protein CpaE
MSSVPPHFDATPQGLLSVVMMGPDPLHRKAIAEALAGVPIGQLREISAYPTQLDDLPRVLEAHCDVAIVDLDGNPEYALAIVERIIAQNSATVIVCSALANLELAVRCMRAGAREFLNFPLNPATLAEALARISVRSAANPARRAPKKLFVFLGAKGGCGTTTVASNFAVSLTQETGQSALLIDLALPLGDAALSLGMVNDYSTHNALENHGRLDASFLQTLLAKHTSGLSVLGAPSEFPPYQPSLEALDRLLKVARFSFDYVIVDAGTRMDIKDAQFLDDSATLYLITQVGVTELRNANRMITQYFAPRGPKLQIVVNRYQAQALLFDDKQLEKALTRAIDWKVPEDSASARRRQISAVPLAMEDSVISRAIRRMARKAGGLPEEDAKKRAAAGMFSWARKGLTKLSASPAGSDAKNDGLPLGAAHAMDTAE